MRVFKKVLSQLKSIHMQEMEMEFKTTYPEMTEAPYRITRRMRRGAPKRGNNRKTTDSRRIQYVSLPNGKTKKVIHERFQD